MPAVASDHYAILGVKDDASDNDVRSAYRALVKKQHPDVCKEKDAGERFKAIQEAFKVLSDPVARASYDRECAEAKFGTVPRDLMDTLLDEFADFIQHKKNKTKTKVKRMVRRVGIPDLQDIPPGYDVPEDPFF